MKHTRVVRAAVVLSLAAAGAACDRSAAAGPPAKADAPAKPAAKAASPKKPVAARIAFLDLQDACKCTKARIDASWEALQTARKSKPAVVVERIHVDTQEALADVITVERPLVVPPGLYFVDSAGEVLELLQGELTVEQIRTALARYSP